MGSLLLAKYGKGDGVDSRYPLTTEYQMGIPPLSSSDFRVSKSDTKDYLIDKQATEYLKDTLDLFKQTCGINFQPIIVDSDGSCLPHAVSRCLIGREALYDALRLELVIELTEHEAFYKQIFQQGRDEDEWKAHWQQIIEEACPTHGSATARWLGPGEHILGLANALGRPILLLDTPENMQKDNYASGLYVPMRLGARDDVCKAHGLNGVVPSPIVIAWANEKHNHFIALIRPEPDSYTSVCMELSESFWTNIKEKIYGVGNGVKKMPLTVPEGVRGGDECHMKDPKTGENFIVRIPMGKKAGDSFEGLQERVGSPIEEAVARIFACNAEPTRKRGCSMLSVVLTNLVDAMLANDASKIAKFGKLKLDNPAVKANLLCVVGARELLEEVGFVVDHSGLLNGGSSIISFAALGDIKICEKLVLCRDIINYMSQEPGSLEGEIVAGKEQLLLGHSGPCLSNMSWEEARNIYAQNGFESNSAKAEKGERAKNGSWTFGSGRSFFRMELEAQSKKLKYELRQEYKEISKSDKDCADMEWEDAAEYHRRLTTLNCPKCNTEQEWKGAIDNVFALRHSQVCVSCNEPLGPEMTGMSKMAKFVFDYVSSEAKLSSLNFSKNVTI